MAGLGRNDVFTVDAALSNIANRLSAGRADYISHKISPRLKVEKSSQKIYTIDPTFEVKRGSQNYLRAPGSAAKTIDFGVNKDVSYSIKNYALKHVIPVEIEADKDAILREGTAPVALLTDTILNTIENQTVSAIGTALVAASRTATPTYKFNDAAASEGPITYLRSRIAIIGSASTKHPNTLGMDYLVFDAIINSPEFKSISQDLGASVDNRTPYEKRREMLATMLNLGGNGGSGSIHVAGFGAQVNSAASGATASLAPIWGENVFIGCVETPTGSTYSGTFVTPTWSNAVLRENLRFESNAETGGEFYAMTKWDDDISSYVTQVGVYLDPSIAMNVTSGYWVTNTLN